MHYKGLARGSGFRAPWDFLLAFRMRIDYNRDRWFLHGAGIEIAKGLETMDRLSRNADGRLLWHWADPAGDRGNPEGATMIGQFAACESAALSPHVRDRCLLHLLGPGGLIHITYRLGKRFTLAHVSALRERVSCSGVHYTAYRTDLAECLETDRLEETNLKNVLFDRDTGQFWFYAVRCVAGLGDCQSCYAGTVYPVGGQLFCSDCGGVHYWCERCADRLTLGSYCDACVDDDDECSSNHIHQLRDYSYKPRAIFFGTDSKFPRLYFGHEIEMTSNDRDLVSRLTARDEVYCKRDGSLSDNGLEVVTHPMTYEHSRKVLEAITDAARKGKARGHNADCSCGHHIHTPTNAWTDYAIHRALHAMSIPHWRDLMVFTSQRQAGDLAAWASPLAVSRETAARVAKYKSGCSDLGRYTAINVGKTTIEFRLFRSNIVCERLIKNMQFVLVTHHIAHSLLSFTEDTLIDLCKQHGYLELLAFVKQRKQTLAGIRAKRPLETLIANVADV